MTLVELLVVMAVLMALATMAFTGSEGLMERARSAETRRRGKTASLAVTGEGEAASRFLDDMGRVPHVLSTTEGELLAELFDRDTVDANALWDSTAANTDEWQGEAVTDAPPGWLVLPTSVSLPCGWRGPYFILNRATFYDGWGHDWQVDAGTWAASNWKGPATVALDDPVRGLRSLGRDNAAGGAEWYDQEQTYAFEEGLATASLTVELLHEDTGAFVPVTAADMDRLRVALYAPYVTRNSLAVKRLLATRDPGPALVLTTTPAAVAGYPHDESASWEDHHRVRFDDLAPGTRRLYAYGYLTGPSNEFASGILQVELKPGSNSLSVYLNQGL